jgi:hypothetical protein
MARRCQNPYLRYDAATDTMTRRRCGRWRCSVECRCLWRTKYRRKLIATLQARPAKYKLRLTAYGVTDDRQLGRAHSGFFKMLRKYVGCGYWWINEWSDGHRHLHAIIRAVDEISRDLVARLWRAALPDAGTSCYFRPIQDQTRLAIYVTKLKEVPPPSFPGRLYGSSRKFFAPASQGLTA